MITWWRSWLPSQRQTVLSLSSEWILEVWREVYNLPKASPGGYTMKGKIQFTELQLLRVVKGECQLSKSRVFLEQIEGNFDFVLFCQILNTIFAPVRPEHFQHNLLAFYNHAWAAITNLDAPTLDWGEVVKKTVARQIKSLGVCNETVSDSDTETEPEDEKEPEEEVPRVFCEGEASGSKPLDLKLDFAEWGNHVESFSRETARLFEAFHVNFGSVIAKAVA
ncbi:hypothetical protein R1flu_016001 [Riccia fluitans]|uniref:Uncharacterized protein n=1 Tax=Riccia fluitans TaxID=41844 RepID=A0ABD1YLD2_9MARC